MMDEGFVLDRVLAHGGQPDRSGSRQRARSRAAASRSASARRTDHAGSAAAVAGSGPGYGNGPGYGSGTRGSRQWLTAPFPVVVEPAAQQSVPAQGSPADARSGPQRAAYDQNDPVVNVERQALKLAIQRPALCGPVFDELPPAYFTVPAHAAVCELIAANGGVARAGRRASGRNGCATARRTTTPAAS